MNMKRLIFILMFLSLCFSGYSQVLGYEVTGTDTVSAEKAFKWQGDIMQHDSVVYVDQKTDSVRFRFVDGIWSKWYYSGEYVKTYIGTVKIDTTNITGLADFVSNNSTGGAFSTTGGVTSNANGTYASDDFVFGSPTLNLSSQPSRFFFDKSLSAFRAGRGLGTFWNDVNVGGYSAAFGFNSKASGLGSFAANSNTVASGTYSTAFNMNSQATGAYSFAANQSYATGEYSFSANRGSASGTYSFASGYSYADSFFDFSAGRYNTGGGTATSWVNTDPLFEVGNGASSSARNNAFTVYKNGNADVDSVLTIGDSLTVTNSITASGYKVTGGDSTQVLFADGSVLKTDSIPLSRFKNDLSITGEGAFSTTSGVTSNANGSYMSDDFVFGSTALDFNGQPRRFFFDKSKGAFRAGNCIGAYWNDTYRGNFSAAFNMNTTASGNASFAANYVTTASGIYAAAFNNNSKATGDCSFAVNQSHTSGEYSFASNFGSASGGHSFAAGYGYADSYESFAVGQYNTGGGTATSWVNTDPLFEVGNGTSSSARNNAFTVYKNGNADVDSVLTVGDSLTVAGSVTAPSFVVPDGTSGQFLKADGSIDSNTYLTGLNDTGVSAGSYTYPSDIVVNSQGRITHIGGLDYLPAYKGGTGQTSYTTGDILYASGSSSLSKLSAGTSGYVLTSNGAGNAPSWQAVSSSGDGTWGSITGTLSNQTDLQTALNEKFNTTGGSLSGALSGTSATFSSTVSAGGNINVGNTDGTGWSFVPSGTTLYIKYNGTTVFSIDSSGNIKTNEVYRNQY